MNIWIQISPGTTEPIYTQIVNQVSSAIASGKLSIGDKLPAVRTLAAELVVNPNTVAKSYSILEQQGLVNTKTGAGTFVADPALRSCDPSNITIITKRLDNIIAHSINIGLSHDQIKELMNNRLIKFQALSTKGGQV